jgi:hypothetical protein
MHEESVRRLKSTFETADRAWEDIVRKRPELENAERTARHLDDRWVWRVRYEYGSR